MPTRHEQIGERAGHDEAMSVLREPAIAHLGEAEDPLDDPDGMLDLGPHLRLGPVFRPVDFVHDTAMAVAAVDEVPRSWCVLTDHRPLAAIRLVAPHAGLVAVQQIGQHRTVATLAGVAITAWISLLRLATPKCPFVPKHHWFPFFI
jgi:hypothetical protein